MNRPKVRHVAVMTKNREKMVEFYQKIFGLEPKRGFGGAIYMSDGDVNIALIEAKREEQKEGINHFGFEVDDLDEIKAQAKGRRIFLRDRLQVRQGFRPSHPGSRRTLGRYGR